MTLLLLAACNPGDVSASPATVDWGEVDFHNADPDECDEDEGGCDPRTVAITNNGTGEATLSASGFDSDHICVQGFAPGGPIDIGLLGPSATYNLVLSVCGYGPGERNQEISGDLVFSVEDATQESLTVSWTFIPVRNIETDDTASN